MLGWSKNRSFKEEVSKETLKIIEKSNELDRTIGKQDTDSLVNNLIKQGKSEYATAWCDCVVYRAKRCR